MKLARLALSGSLFLFAFQIGLANAHGQRASAPQKSSNDKSIFITVGSDTVANLESKSLIRENFNQFVKSANSPVVLEVKESELDNISNIMHEDFKRCGGFVGHNTLEEAIDWANNQEDRATAKFATFADYNINQQDQVSALLAQVNATSIERMIRNLSNFHNRYYKAQSGVDSQQAVLNAWGELVKGRSDSKVEFYRHPSWPQPSVILTITGSEIPSEIIVVGGHADSISGMFGDRSTARAPGADDNASGISTVTEIIRVLTQSSYRPKRTIKFMAYAAEEVGLWGSKEIAQQAKRENWNVVGVLQLDMTNFKGSNSVEINLVNDFTNREQNAFLGKLIDTYVKVPWGQDGCGYACSDHASWHGQGYPASIPFESLKGDMNRRIHTAQDTIEISGGNAAHAAKFAQLGLAYVVELDN